MNLEDINNGIVKNRPRKRIGRGVGSKTGKTAGRGHNGHKSRSGYSRHPIFNGGDLPMVRRIPKRGFHNRWAATVFGVNLSAIDALFVAGEEVNPTTLREKGLVKVRCDEVKILGDGELTKALKFVVTRASETAKEKIAKAGGTIEIVAAKRTPEERVAALKAE
ncbi:50S ribosomal protein L15 [Pirellula sp. SH-Sr6A]|uniref:50S ribosomal protein L15 n=1 Tax=Pirellula sp. SH-Sr6A TaxID=1632865 RepID=UPI00078E4513|nr:50S ribosomal protein L15 [Pirellula sp. SH-Sr6A]AMV34469.1 50S ribosomal protein L15 [Pirellula sp. SH-Sr6A]